MSEKEAIKSLKRLIKVLSVREEEYILYPSEFEVFSIVLNYIYKLINKYNKRKEEIEKLQKEIEQEQKLTNLIIDDFQAENYFVNMTNEEVREYYSKRKELK